MTHPDGDLPARHDTIRSRCEACDAPLPHPADPARLAPNLCIDCIIRLPKDVSVRQVNDWVSGVHARHPLPASVRVIEPADALRALRR